MGIRVAGADPLPRRSQGSRPAKARGAHPGPRKRPRKFPDGLFFVDGRLIAARRGNHDAGRAQGVQTGRAGACSLTMRYPGIDD